MTNFFLTITIIYNLNFKLFLNVFKRKTFYILHDFKLYFAIRKKLIADH